MENTDIRIYRPSKEEALQLTPYLVIEFAKEIQCPIMPHMRDIQISINNLYSKMILIFAARGPKVMGGMQSVVFPHIWNEDELASQEMFFWIHPSQRGGSTALRMIRAHEKELDDRGVTVRAMSLMTETSPEGVARVYGKMGYKNTERLYTKWITS